MVYVSPKEPNSNGSSLFDSDNEEVFVADVRTPLIARTPHLKKYDDAGGVPSNSRGSPSNQNCPHRQYSFKEKHVGSLFELLNKSNKLRLWAVRRLEEVGKIDHPNYCLFHKMIGHPHQELLHLLGCPPSVNQRRNLEASPQTENSDGQHDVIQWQGLRFLLKPRGVFLIEVDSDVPPLMDSKLETIVPTTQMGVPLVDRTQS